MSEQVTDIVKPRSKPSDIEAEKAVIASLIMSRTALVKIIDTISPDDFYLSLHQLLIVHILKLYNEGSPIDLVTLNHSLKGNPVFIKENGLNYLNILLGLFPTTANAEYYVKILREKAELRRLLDLGCELASLAFAESDNAANLIDNAESKIFEIAHKRIREDFQDIRTVMKSTLQVIESRYHQRDGYSGVASGFKEIDDLTGGFQKSDLIIIAARPSMGKTALALNMLENVSMKFEKGVVFFSLEMSKHQICQRLISSASRIDSHKLRTGRLQRNEFPIIANAVNELSKAKIFLDDTPGTTTFEIRAKLRRLLARESLELLIVDYLQLLSPSNSYRKMESRQIEIAEISRNLKNIAREFNIPVIALSQLSRMVESRSGDHRPRLSDLRDSGAIEQDADVVMFIYRDEYYFPDDPDNQGKAEIIISKQRNGPIGKVDLAFNKSQSRFDNLQKIEVT